MPIKRIGLGDASGEPMVLADPDSYERQLLAILLNLGERHLDEVPNLRSYRENLGKMITGLRAEFGLPMPLPRTPPASGAHEGAMRAIPGWPSD